MKNLIKTLLTLLSFNLTAQTVIKVEKISEKTYKVFTDKSLEGGKNYDFKVFPTAINYTENAVIIDTLPSCKNGGSFDIVSIKYENDIITFSYNASNLYKGMYDLSIDNVVVNSGEITPTSNVIAVNVGMLKSGDYEFRLNGRSCNGEANKGFNVISGIVNVSDSTIITDTHNEQNDVSKVYHVDGKKIYNKDGSLNKIVINPIITNDYFFSETINRGCPDGASLMYAFDEGDYTGENTRGWKNYPVKDIDLSAMQGKTMLFMSACVGSAYNDVTDTHSTFIYLKKNKGINRSTTQLKYVDYASSYVPDFSNNLPSVFRGGVPQFEIPNKSNIYEGTMPTESVDVDLRKYGIKYWHLKGSAKDKYPSELNYITDNDNWANQVGFRPELSNPSANTTTFEDMQSKANVFSSYGNLGILLSDDEWRWGQFYKSKGIANMYAFYEKTKQNLPNTLLGAHHNSPYIYNKNTQTAQDDKNCFNGYYKNERELFYSLGGGFLAQYWQDVPDKKVGDNIGNTLFSVIPFDMYVHFYNPVNDIYKLVQTALVNDKYYPNKLTLASVEGWLELLGDYQQRHEIYSWKTSENSAETLLDFIPISPSHLENVSLFANITGKGFNLWGNFLTTQTKYPNAYYANNSLVGTPSGYVNRSIADKEGVYENTYRGHLDYLFLGLHKFSKIPQDYDFENKIMYEVSTDGGITWETDFNNVPGVLGRNKKPMAIGIKNANGKHAIVAVHPYNSPRLDYTFKIRSKDMKAIDVTVTGHFPQLILNNNSVQ